MDIGTKQASVFYRNCGGELPGSAQSCPKCGAAGSVLAEVSKEITHKAKLAGQDAMGAVRIVVVNPVGGLATAFGQLDAPRTWGVAIGFAVFYDAAVGGNLSPAREQRWRSSTMMAGES